MRRKNRPEAHPDERNDLVISFSSLVKIFYPKIVMLENVPGMEIDYRYSKFLSDLVDLQYTFDYEILNLQEYGVPQRRKRLLLLASRTGKTPDIKKIERSQATTVRSVIGDLPSPAETDNEIHKLVLNSGPCVKKRISSIPKDGGSRSDLPDELTLKCHKKSSSNGFKDVYGRLSWDKVSPTITGGCFNPSKGRFIHPEQDRAISIYEAALLQSFPKDYKFLLKNGLSRNAAMIGNALPPKFSESVSKYVMELL
jgi:DNA (cytosine-5)-methyltransferase 1